MHGASLTVPPKLKKLKSSNVHVGEKISLKCEATAGNPQPSYKWFKDGKELKKSKDIRIKYGNGKKISRLQFNKVKLEDAGEYSCEAENVLGKDTAKGSLNVRSGTTKAPQVLPASETKIVVMEEEYVQMDSSDRDVWRNCLCDCTCQILSKVSDRIHRRPVSAFRNGQLLQSVLRQYDSWLCHVGKNRKSTRRNKEGEMSEKRIAHSLRLKKVKEAEELYQKRVLTITGICVALLVVGIVCVVAYCKTKKQRKQMHNHLRQNMCPAHQNRSLANGPSHPRLDPEEIQMADYISKNVSATEHVIRRETETTFSGSHSCSPSHHCSTATPTSSQRHESHTWSLERTESLTSDSQSGIMLSSVGTSKCNSPACVEARARRGAAFCIEDSRRPMMQYRDSVDSLRDSPHSERYVSALTTPARLSPVDFHYSMATQVPTFEITSPNSAHAVSLPPAAPISFRVEEQQPLLRRYQLPFQDTQRYDSYYQRKTYLNDSMGSLPSSPFRITEDDEYETTQEYVTALEQPKKTASSNKRWKKSKLNGHVPHRARAVRDSFSLSSASYSESDEELVAESTPFLSTQNNETMNTESPPLHRPGDSRTYHSYSRHSAHGESGRSSLAHTTPKQDPDPL
ncbi:pro-neuregulin-2, membrane-bound isoform isoform X6 [Oxyura jamaicensis]|uniref:pro-neuregulin-2, membrane-bound isoform isoform X6 n=1 Tax=Oxyura jamaicensis TaxID=8884 RepID=UPI0015A52C4A|nr:pro-neuregulin-2, membrane-bound isoform isoform X6 [Oxyura jamaicensis]